MKNFWKGVAHLLVTAAVYAVGHPDEVIKIIGVIKDAKAKSKPV